jgi:hypothetical protein
VVAHEHCALVLWLRASNPSTLTITAEDISLLPAYNPIQNLWHLLLPVTRRERICMKNNTFICPVCLH